MANTVLKHKNLSVRMNYHDLAEVLSIINQRAAVTSVVRTITEPWLDHIKEDVGYVLLDTQLLENSEAVGVMEHVLADVIYEVKNGTLLPKTQRWELVKNDREQMSAYFQRLELISKDLQRFLQSIQGR